MQMQTEIPTEKNTVKMGGEEKYKPNSVIMTNEGHERNEMRETDFKRK